MSPLNSLLETPCTLIKEFSDFIYPIIYYLVPP